MIIALALVSAFALTAVALARTARQTRTEEMLVEVVREATEPYQDVSAAEAAGYGLFRGCVSGPEGVSNIFYTTCDKITGP